MSEGWIITADQLRQELKDPSSAVVLVDVREQDEFDEKHIEGCKLIPLDEISTRGPSELDPAANIVLYCAHGVRSLHALMALRMAGFEKLRSLEGGIEAWLNSASS